MLKLDQKTLSNRQYDITTAIITKLRFFRIHIDENTESSLCIS